MPAFGRAAGLLSPAAISSFWGRQQVVRVRRKTQSKGRGLVTRLVRENISCGPVGSPMDVLNLTLGVIHVSSDREPQSSVAAWLLGLGGCADAVSCRLVSC